MRITFRTKTKNTLRSALRILCLVICFYGLTGCAKNSNVSENMESSEITSESIVMETPSKEKPEKDIIITVEKDFIQYGALKLQLLNGYTCKVQDTTAYLVKDGITVGGMNCYRLPDVPFDYSIDWLCAMGLPEAQKTEEPIAYMISNSVNSHMVAEFFHELEPERLNTEHNFYVDGNLVYDIYYDQNVLSDGNAEKLLRTVELNGILLAPEKPEEKISIQMCNAVLEMIRSGSYQIAIEKANEGSSILNKRSSTVYTANGENWISITAVPDDQSYHAYMSVSGSRFSNENAPASEPDGTVCWYSDTIPEQIYVPWLASFMWNEDSVFYTDTITYEGVKTVMLRIDEPLTGYEDLSDYYYVDFHFTPEGRFLNAVIELEYLVDFNINRVEITESILSLDENEVTQYIDKEYQRAIQ